MESDGLNQILTGFYLLGPVRARRVPRDSDRILTGLNGIWLKTVRPLLRLSADPIYPGTEKEKMYVLTKITGTNDFADFSCNILDLGSG